jgi:hypothetical protein
MTLIERQQLFARLLPRLLDKAYELGFAVSLGEAWRTPEQARANARAGTGTLNSLHTLRLAIDLNLFRGHIWLQDTESHRSLGLYWKSLHPLCRWGGDFTRPDGRPDGNHYSIEWEGRA